MSRRNKDEDHSPIILAVKDLVRSTEATYSAVLQIERAFLLGLWYKSFPDYTLEHLEKAYGWNHKELMPEEASVYDEPYENFLRFQFTADTGDSWHQCYRDFRERGWQRLRVHRDGGRLQYLLKLEDNFTWAHEGEAGAYKVYDKPEGFRELHLLLDISISTCKQVQIGTEMKEVPIMKTVCEDLVEIQESDSAESVGEVIPLVVVNDIEELQQRRSGEVDSIVEINGETFVADIKLVADEDAQRNAAWDRQREQIAASLKEDADPKDNIPF